MGGCNNNNNKFSDNYFNNCLFLQGQFIEIAVKSIMYGICSATVFRSNKEACHDNIKRWDISKNLANLCENITFTLTTKLKIFSLNIQKDIKFGVKLNNFHVTKVKEFEFEFHHHLWWNWMKDKFEWVY